MMRARPLIGGEVLRLTQAVPVFLAFAFAYFLSALLRAVTATLAPVFSVELGLQAADLGLLAGAYFFGFAAMQLPSGKALDRFGPRRVLLLLLAVAVFGCLAFALSRSLAGLIAARVLIGIGVSACLMAPLTCYRRILDPSSQLRANSWMLMTGSLGMLASTLPVQWVLPYWGWRGLFVALAALMLLAIALVWKLAPVDPSRPAQSMPQAAAGPGYRSIMRHPAFIAMAPLGFFNYGGLIAIQSLWAGPWLTEVSGWTPAQAAQGLFAINLSMLFAFMTWGVVMPRLVKAGVSTRQLIGWGLPSSLALLAAIIALGADTGAAYFALWCVCSTFVVISQPAVAQAFPAELAGRALSAFNLLIFAGVFCLQWGIGLAVDAFMVAGWSRIAAFQGAFAAFGLGCAMAYAWFLLPHGVNVDNRA
jgi:predicted MFS family arabinose efflux permease